VLQPDRGTVHTHPHGVPAQPPEVETNPSGPDKELARDGKCGINHYVVSRFGVIEYHRPDAAAVPRRDIATKVNARMATATCSQVKSEDDLP
jgi:hypothetical protein